MSAVHDEYQQRVRERAHDIWLREGKPDGQADAHWALAREEIAAEENLKMTLKPVDDGPDAEPLLAVDGMADLPGRLSDQGERQDYPSPPAAKPRKPTSKAATTKPSAKKKPA